MKLTFKKWVNAMGEILFAWNNFGTEAKAELRAIRKGVAAVCTLLGGLFLRAFLIITFPLSAILVAFAHQKNEEYSDKQHKLVLDRYNMHFTDDHEHG